MAFEEDFRICVKSRVPFISVETQDEKRLMELIKEAVKELDARNIYRWSITRGLMKEIPVADGPSSGFWPGAYKNKETTKSMWKLVDKTIDPQKACCTPIDFFTALAEIPEEEAAIIIVQDFIPYLSPQSPDGVKVQRRLKDYYQYLKGVKKTLIFTSALQTIPQEMKDYFAVLDVPLPNKEELRKIFDFAYSNYKAESVSDYKRKEVVDQLEKQIKDSPHLIDRMIAAGVGLTAETFETVVSKQIARHEFSIKMIVEEKKQIIKRQGMLEYWDPEVGIAGVGGLENAKEMIRSIIKCDTVEAENRGVKPPKSILLMGPPGTGKTLLAKVLAVETERPLLILNMSNLVSKWLGETGQNVTKGLRQRHQQVEGTGNIMEYLYIFLIMIIASMMWWGLTSRSPMGILSLCLIMGTPFFIGPSLINSLYLSMVRICRPRNAPIFACVVDLILAYFGILPIPDAALTAVLLLAAFSVRIIAEYMENPAALLLEPPAGRVENSAFTRTSGEQNLNQELTDLTSRPQELVLPTVADEPKEEPSKEDVTNKETNRWRNLEP